MMLLTRTAIRNLVFLICVGLAPLALGAEAAAFDPFDNCESCGAGCVQCEWEECEEPLEPHIWCAELEDECEWWCGGSPAVNSVQLGCAMPVRLRLRDLVAIGSAGAPICGG